jgi:hypothetical protein
MKTVIAVTLVIAFAALGSAQTSAPARSTLLIRAEQMSGLTMQGNVEATATVAGTVQFKADSIELTDGGQDLVLHGTVVLRLPDAPRVIARDSAGRILAQ